MKTEITLAICMYNAEKYIEETLACIKAQTMQDFHLLLVDDCSTDRTVEYVERFFQQKQRQYELVKLTQNQGIAYGRNFALHHAQTKYLIFVDSDDLPLPLLLEKEYQVLSNDENLIAVSSWSQFIDAKSKKMRGGLFVGDTTKAQFLKRAQAAKRVYLPIQTMFDRAAAIRVGGFSLDGYPDGKPRYRDFCEDLDLWTRLSDLYAEGKYIIVLPEVLYLYRKSEGLSSSHFNMIIKMEYVKVNLRRRRWGMKELTFIDYYNSLSKRELKRLQKDSHAADCLRNGVFYIREKKIIRGLALLFECVWNHPSYIIDKVIANSGWLKQMII